MKLFKKIALAFTAALCIATAGALAACGENNPDADLPEDTYVFYVYLDDGTTPVENISFQICYNTDAEHSSCSVQLPTTDKNGRAEVDLSKDTFTDGLSVHIVGSTSYNDGVGAGGLLPKFPQGYTHPANTTTVTLNGGVVYEHAFLITEQVTIFKLAKI